MAMYMVVNISFLFYDILNSIFYYIKILLSSPVKSSSKMYLQNEDYLTFSWS